MEEPKRNTPDAVGADENSTRLEYSTGLLHKNSLVTQAREHDARGRLSKSVTDAAFGAQAGTLL
jgi:hypothetical protein